MHVIIVIILVLFIGLFVVMSVPLKADGSAHEEQPEVE
jgi:hypothetical protein